MRFDQLKRREFIGMVGSAAASWPLASFAQSPEQMRRVGVVMAYAEDDPNGRTQIDAFRDHLRTLGWTEGGNITIDVRYAKDSAARAREAAADLLRQMPDLMVSNSNLGKSARSPLCSYPCPIRWAAALSRSWRGPAAPLPGLPIFNLRWGQVVGETA